MPQFSEEEKAEVADIFECFGVVVVETLRLARAKVNTPAPHSDAARASVDSGSLREDWRNLSNKIMTLMEKYG